MNILLVTHEYPPYPGGVGRYCASLAAAAQRAGHTVTVLAPDHGSPQAKEANDAIKVIRFSGDVFHLMDLPKLRAQITKVLSDAPRPFDVIHAADWPAVIALRTIKTPQSRRIATLHGTDILLMKRSIRARLARASTALASFEKYACNSRYTQSLLAAHYPKLVSKAVVTPLGVDTDWFAETNANDLMALKERIKHQDSDVVVLTVARLDSRKGQLTTIRALERLPAELKQHVHYVCVGKEVEAGYGAKLQSLAHKCGIRLTLTGRLPDGELTAAYSLATVFALTGEEVPQKVEGFGLVLLEAAAKGLPAIVTKVQALPEVVVHGQTGWVCANDNELAHAFLSALNKSTLPALKANSIAHAHSYTWDRCADLTYA